MSESGFDSSSALFLFYFFFVWIVCVFIWLKKSNYNIIKKFLSNPSPCPL